MEEEKPTKGDQEQVKEDTTREGVEDERPSEEGASVDEQSEQSFPASDPPSY